MVSLRCLGPLSAQSSVAMVGEQSKKIIIDTDPGIGFVSSPFFIKNKKIFFYWIRFRLASLNEQSLFLSFGSSRIFKSLYFGFSFTVFDDYVDDAMAIFVALNSPEVDVIGLTTIYGNVYTTLATRNALHLVSFILFTFGSPNQNE